VTVDNTLPPLALNAWLRYDVIDRTLPTAEPINSILEIGMGRGGVGARLAQRAKRYVGVEQDPVSHQIAERNLRAVAPDARVLRGDVAAVVPPDETFDVVCAFEVVEHLEDDAAAIKAWSQYVRPGGHLLLSVPAFAKRFGPWDELAGHFRRYDPETMTGLLRGAGFTDVEVVVYGFPLGLALERVRNVVARVRNRRLPASAAERTAASGRVLQPKSSRSGRGIELATLPFRILQRRFPGRGTGLVVLARRPESPS
jgi:SAM-dependent methyltransferase